MTKVVVVAGGDLDLPLPIQADVFVGVDRACLPLLTAGLPLDLAIGDFDSVTAEENKLVQQRAKELIRVSPQKDDTDLELALRTVFDKWPRAEVFIYGGLGGRLDHTLSTIFLPSHPALSPFMRQFSLVDRQNKVFFYPSGQHRLSMDPDYTYVAFLLEGQGQLVISGAKYDLNPANYFQRKIYSSNEFLDGPIEVTVPSGYLIAIYSKDR